MKQTQILMSSDNDFNFHEFLHTTELFKNRESIGLKVFIIPYH